MDFFNIIEDDECNEFNKYNDNNKVKQEQSILYSDFKKGDMVRIIYKKDSILNTYKGYLGEIKTYKKNTEYARVFLHGINSFNVINFPVDHFIHN